MLGVKVKLKVSVMLISVTDIDTWLLVIGISYTNNDSICPQVIRCNYNDHCRMAVFTIYRLACCGHA